MAATRVEEPTIKEGFRLGEWLVQPGLGRLSRNGSAIHLEPKHMDLLVCLAQHPREIRTKDQIFDAVWPDQFIAESALTKAVAELRRALEDDARAPTYIETVPKRGYRLIGEIGAPATRPRESRRVGWWLGLAVALTAVLLGAWIFVSKPEELPSNGPLPPFRQRQVTTSMAIEVNPSFSPDGSSLVYSSDQTGSFQLYVRDLTPGGRERALTEDGHSNIQPTWSPDGSWIAYYSIDRGLWMLPSMGGQPRQVAAFGSNPTWSPDSTRLVFESEGPWFVWATSPLPGSLWMVDIGQGSTPRQITWPSKPRGGHRMPAFSPDGDYVFFSNGRNLWRLDLIDNSLRRFPQPGSALDPVVSKDGKTLYYMASIQGELWLSSMRLDVDEPEQKTLFAVPARHLGLSPDGNRFVLSKFDATSNLWSVDLDPATDLPLGPAAALTRETNRRNTVPRFSPDGDTIAYSRFALGDKGSVLTISPDGTEQTEIYSQLDNAVKQPQWTSDGKALYLQGSQGFQMLDLETQRIETIAAYDDYWLQWSISPNGKQIAFSREVEAITNIWVADLQGNATQITFDPLYAAFPTWSPDGKWITFELFRDGYTYLGIVPSAGGEITRLTFEPQHSWPWGWSPDGSKIAIAASRDGVWNIWWISLEDGSTTKITDHQRGRGSYVRYPAWSPSGDQIVYELSDSTSDIWFLDLER